MGASPGRTGRGFGAGRSRNARLLRLAVAGRRATGVIAVASRARHADKRLLGLGLLPSFVSRFSRNCTSSTKKAVLQLGVNGKLINIKTVFFLSFLFEEKDRPFSAKKKQ